jgi:hypothetical protein
MPAEFGVPTSADFGADFSWAAVRVAGASPGGVGPQAPSHTDNPIMITAAMALYRFLFDNTFSLKIFSK